MSENIWFSLASNGLKINFLQKLSFTVTYLDRFQLERVPIGMGKPKHMHAWHASLHSKPVVYNCRGFLKSRIIRSDGLSRKFNILTPP